MLFLDKSLISDSLNTVHNVQFLFISRSVISMVIGVDIMALVKTHLYSFYSMQTNATDPKTLIEL